LRLGFFAASTHGISIRSLIAARIVAAILGEIVGFWVGRRFGDQLLTRYAARLGFTAVRINLSNEKIELGGNTTGWDQKHPLLAPPHSITSSARASSVGGTVSPSALAALRLMTSRNFVGA
jgi:hypothetical protein